MPKKIVPAEISSNQRQDKFTDSTMLTPLSTQEPRTSERDIVPIKLLYSIREVLKLLSIGKNTFYKLKNNKELKTVKIEGRTLIHIDEIHRFLRSLPTV